MTTENKEVHFFPNEEWKELKLEHKTKFRYAISNFGRMISFTDEIKWGRLLKGSRVENYSSFNCSYLNGKKRVYVHLLIHKLVAIHFLPAPTTEQIYVMHIDRNRTNNIVSNLKWVTQDEMTKHNLKNPKFWEAHRQSIITKRNRGNGHKLNSTTVRLIKKKVLDPNRKTRMKLIAKQFGISEMQLYRIKSGENWGHIKI